MIQCYNDIKVMIGDICSKYVNLILKKIFFVEVLSQEFKLLISQLHCVTIKSKYTWQISVY